MSGLPSLRSLQKKLLETHSERSQNFITVEQDTDFGEPSFFDLKVQKPEPSPYVEKIPIEKNVKPAPIRPSLYSKIEPEMKEKLRLRSLAKNSR